MAGRTTKKAAAKTADTEPTGTPEQAEPQEGVTGINEADETATEKPDHADDPGKDFGDVPLDHKPSDDTGDVDDDDFAGAKIDSGETPRTAQIEPPAEKIEERARVESQNVADVAAERLQYRPATVTDGKGGSPDPDEVFGPVEADGFRRARIELLQRSHQTIYDRPVTTLLLAAGSKVTEANAEAILKVIRDERAR